MSDQSIPSVEEIEWRDVPGYPGFRASSQGNVETRWKPGVSRGGVIRGKYPSKMDGEWMPVKTNTDKDGYLKFKLPASASSNGKWQRKSVHVFVCLAFHGIPQPGHQVAHFPDPNPTNNRPENLNWKTCQENHDDKRVHGTNPAGERNPRANITEDVVREVRRLSKVEKMRRGKIAAKLRIPVYTVAQILGGLTWKHVT